jgi:hypothetical protein
MWSEDMIQKVWEKGEDVSNNDPTVWRKDECGAWIGREHYADRKSQYGWEIGYISPGGPDVNNLRPLQWENNGDTNDGRVKCNVVASGKENTKK